VAGSQEALREAKRRSFDIAFIDLRLEGEDGMDLIPPLLVESPWLKIVVITANATIETAVEAMRRGAADYIEKPFTSAQVRLLIRTLGHIRDLENEITVLKEDRRRFAPEALLQSRNPEMLKIIETLYKAATSDGHDPAPGRERHRQIGFRQNHSYLEPAGEKADDDRLLPRGSFRTARE